MDAGTAPPLAPRLRDLRVAVQLLTRLPAGRSAVPTNGLAGASAWFPAVGLLVAAIGVAVRAGLDPFVGPVPATVAAVLATVVVTGAFHEDGLADTADGLWGGWDVEQRLAIMRDSRLGTYGTTALVGDLALRTTLLAGLDVVGFARASVAAEVLGRLVPPLLLAWLPPARSDGQGVRASAPNAAGWGVALGTAVGVLAVVAGGAAPVAALALLCGTGAVGGLARDRLGGVTGDVLGAGVRVGALAVTATLVAVWRGGG